MWIRWIPLALALLLAFSAPAAVQTEQPLLDEDAFVQSALISLTPEQKLGQVVMVSFFGSGTEESPEIRELIRDNKVGSVYLNHTHCNVINGSEDASTWEQEQCDLTEVDPDTPAQVAQLNNGLQALAYEATSWKDGENEYFLPLLIAVDHEGDGYPLTHLRHRFTAVPSQMAIGATWDENWAEEVGKVVGEELGAVGVNMLLGPVVDVMTEPKPSPQDRGVRVFGSHPDLVTRLGKAYVRGVHEGSERADNPRVLTVVKHFPGHGASDRNPDLEIAQIRATLEELYGSHLLPFAELVRSDASEDETPDGIMVSHLAYQSVEGCQAGAGQVELDPVSLNPSCRQGFADFLDERSESGEDFSSWRAEHVIVADSLGVTALRKQYDYARDADLCWVAEQALMAGNDIIPFVEWHTQEDRSRGGAVQWEKGRIQHTLGLECLQKEYDQNGAFAQRVDEAAERVIRAKVRLYPELLEGDAGGVLENVVKVSPDHTRQVIEDDREDDMRRLARDGLTLVLPHDGDWRGIPKYASQHILFVECWDDVCCSSSPELLRGVLKKATLARVSGEMLEENLRTLTFSEMREGIDSVQADLQWADWIVFGISESVRTDMLGIPADELRALMGGEYPGLESIATKPNKVIITYDRPYIGDATTLFKATAVLAAYSKAAPAVEASIEALLGKSSPKGTLPVAYAEAGYAKIEPPEGWGIVAPTVIATPTASPTPVTPPATPPVTPPRDDDKGAGEDEGLPTEVLAAAITGGAAVLAALIGLVAVLRQRR